MKSAITAVVLLTSLSITGCDNKNADLSASSNLGATISPSRPLPSAKFRVQDMEKSITCNLEEIGGQRLQDGPAKINLNKDINITGWVIDKATTTNGGNISIQITSHATSDEYEITDISRMTRTDVRAAMGGDSAFENSGINATLPAGSLSSGSYNIAIVYQSNGKPVACAEGNAFTVK